MKTFLSYLLFFTTPLLADTSASFPPNLYETEGGTKSPAFSSASAEASHWINLMDQAQYGSTWMDAGPLFHDIITQEQWIAAMRTLRRPLGVVRSRRVADHRASESLPGGSRGYFMTIRFDTNFSEKPGVSEIVTLMMIQNDQWRVVSYSFK